LIFDLIQIEKCFRDGVDLFIPHRTLFVIGRDLESKIKYIFFINDFYPRFYVLKEDLDYIKKRFSDRIKKVKDQNFMTLELNKRKLFSVYTYTTEDVKEIRKEIPESYEGDIKFTTVFKVERGIKSHFEVSKNIVNLVSRLHTIKNIKYNNLSYKEIIGVEI